VSYKKERREYIIRTKVFVSHTDIAVSKWSSKKQDTVNQKCWRSWREGVNIRQDRQVMNDMLLGWKLHEYMTCFMLAH